MRTADVTYVSPTYRSNSYTFRDNNRILLQKAQQYDGYLQVADWATYSATQRSWVGGDGVHLTPAGAVAVTAFSAEMAAQVFTGSDHHATTDRRRRLDHACAAAIAARRWR